MVSAIQSTKMFNQQIYCRLYFRHVKYSTLVAKENTNEVTRPPIKVSATLYHLKKYTCDKVTLKNVPRVH